MSISSLLRFHVIVRSRKFMECSSCVMLFCFCGCCMCQCPFCLFLLSHMIRISSTCLA